MKKRGNKRADRFKVFSSALNKIGLFPSIIALSPSVSSINSPLADENQSQENAHSTSPKCCTKLTKQKNFRFAPYLSAKTIYCNIKFLTNSLQSLNNSKANSCADVEKFNNIVNITDENKENGGKIWSTRLPENKFTPKSYKRFEDKELYKPFGGQSQGGGIRSTRFAENGVTPKFSGFKTSENGVRFPALASCADSITAKHQSIITKQTISLIKSIPTLLILVLGLLIFSGTALAAQYGSPFEVFGAFEWDDKNYENYWNSIYNNSLFYNNSENIGIRVMTPSEVLTVNGNMSVKDSFYVLDSGNVGIGTSSPTHTLHVDGDMNVSGISYLGDVVLNSDNITVANIVAKAGDENNLTFYNATGQTIGKWRGDGQLQVWDSDGGANDYVSIYHDGTDSFIKSGSGVIQIHVGSGVLVFDNSNLYKANANTGNLGAATQEWLSLYLGEDASSGVYFGLDQDAVLRLNTAQAGGETMMMGLPTTSKSFVVANKDDIEADFDHPAQDNPTLIMHSDLDPDSDNTMWGSIAHDNSSFVIDSGSDTVVIDDNTTISGDLVLGDTEVGTVLVDMYDNSTDFVIDTVHNISFISAEVISTDNVFRMVPIAGGTHPVTCDVSAEGGLYYNNTWNQMCICNGTSWAQMASPGTGC